MPATTTRQSACLEPVADRQQPVQPGDADVVDHARPPAPCTRAVSAASAATGASEVPAMTTATVPRGSGQRAERHRPGDRSMLGLGERRRHLRRAPRRRAGWRAPRGRGASRAACAGSRRPGRASCRRRTRPRRRRCARARSRSTRAKPRSRSAPRCAGRSPPEQASRADQRWVLAGRMTTVDHYAQGTPSYVELTTPDQQAAKELLRAAARLGVRGRRHGRGRDTTSRCRSKATRSPGSRGQMPRAGGPPGVLGRLPGRRRRRRDRRQGRCRPVARSRPGRST